VKPVLVGCEISQNPLCRVINFIRRLLLLPRSFVLRSVFVRGVPAYGKDSFAWLYLGEGESLEHLKSFYFRKIEEENISELSLSGLAGKIKEARGRGILLFVELNRMLSFMVPRQGLLTLPWIRQRVSLKSKDFLDRRRYIEEHYGRKVRKFRYAFKITQDRSSVARFYEQVYAPYIRDKYKDACHLRSLEEFLFLLSSGFLLEVLEEDSVVAGIMCRKGQGTVTAFAFGVAPEYSYHLHRGALSAAYYFLFQWAQANKISTIDLLRSRPHVFDGVYEHKRRWGAVAGTDAWPHTALWVFVAEKGSLPLIFQKQLVWNNGRFMEMGQLTGLVLAHEPQYIRDEESHGADVDDKLDDRRAHEAEVKGGLIKTDGEHDEP